MAGLCINSGNIPAGAPPAPPEEPDVPSPHGPHVPAASTVCERIEDTQMTAVILSSGDADPGGPTDKIHEGRPFIYDPRMASSEFTISYYETAPEVILDTITTTLPSGGAGRPGDDASSTFSFIYDPSLASSGTSIDSCKTERTVNSRKSRYNALPRHKYADHDLLMPQGLASLRINDSPVPKVNLLNIGTPRLD